MDSVQILNECEKLTASLMERNKDLGWKEAFDFALKVAKLEVLHSIDEKIGGIRAGMPG